ncbi:MAG: MGMT family protein [Candidatus Dormibacteraceae bacterium]
MARTRPPDARETRRRRLRALAAEVGPGEWTTYGDLARAADLASARIPALEAATDPRFVNARRVLGAGGRIRRPTGEEVRRVRAHLEREGVRFQGERADPVQRVTWVDLRGRTGG